MTQHFWAYTQIINLWHEGSTILMECYLGICRGPFLATKSHISRICVINGFLLNREDIFFFDGLLHVSCLGWEVKTHMSGQSNNCLRVCNVKMKKFPPGWKRGTFPCMYGLWGPSVNRFEFFSQDTRSSSVYLLQTHFSQNQLDLDGPHTCIPVLVQLTCIWADTAWNLSKILRGILYHKLSLIMLIRRSAGCFKCYFQIFLYLDKIGHQNCSKTLSMPILSNFGDHHM